MPIVKLNKWLSVTFIIILLLFLFRHIGLEYNKVSNLAILDNNISLEIDHSYTSDKYSEVSLQAINANLVSFEKIDLNKAQVDFGEHTYWYKLDLTNTFDNERELVILLDNPMVDYLNIYQLENNKYTLKKALGDLVTEGNSLDDVAMPTLTVKLNKNATASILVSAKTLGAANLPFAIFDQEDFHRYKDASYMLWGSFVGIILVMMVYNLILYIGAGEKVYLLYIGYIGTFLIELSSVIGYGAYLFPDAAHVVFSKQIISANFVVSYFSAMFALYFLRFDQEPKRKLTRFVRFIANVYLVSAFISLFVDEYIAAQVFFTMQVVLYGLVIAMITITIKKGIRWANYYIISWLPLLVGAAVGPMLLTGQLEYNFWTKYALFLGVIFEITFMSMALAQRLRTSEKERVHQSSHDQFFGFANHVMLEHRVNRLLATDTKLNFSVVIVSINKYEGYVPYLSKSNLKNIIYQLVFDLEKEFSNDLLLIDIDPNSQYRKTAMIREGVFAYLVKSNDQHLLHNVLRNFSSKQPVNYQVGDLSLNFVCSSGAAQYSQNEDLHDLLNKAQQVIESAQDQNKLFGIYSETSKSENRKKVKLASDLQNAINHDKLNLYHQPQISLQTNKVIGSEVLLRWQHDIFGFISPDEFVKVAEDTGIINKLSKWVFETSCKHLTQLKKLGKSDHKISVNISVYDVMTDGFISFLVQMINKYQLRADDFVIELTETVSVNDTEKFTRNIAELKDLGFLLSIDDFGTGYSSLTYLSKHPFGELKIDRDFIKDIGESDKNRSIVATTIALAKSLNYKVVAEGIEDATAMSMLKEMDCDFVQGYYISKPQTFTKFIDWLEEYEIRNSFETD